MPKPVTNETPALYEVQKTKLSNLKLDLERCLSHYDAWVVEEQDNGKALVQVPLNGKTHLAYLNLPYEHVKATIDENAKTYADLPEEFDTVIEKWLVEQVKDPTLCEQDVVLSGLNEGVGATSRYTVRSATVARSCSLRQLAEGKAQAKATTGSNDEAKADDLPARFRKRKGVKSMEEVFPESGVDIVLIESKAALAYLCAAEVYDGGTLSPQRSREFQRICGLGLREASAVQIGDRIVLPNGLTMRVVVLSPDDLNNIKAEGGKLSPERIVDLMEADPLAPKKKDHSTKEKDGEFNFELKDVQDYYDIQIIQSVDQGEALRKTELKFGVKGKLTVSPVGVISVDGLLSDKEQAELDAEQAAKDAEKEKAAAQAKADADAQAAKDHEIELAKASSKGGPKVVIQADKDGDGKPDKPKPTTKPKPTDEAEFRVGKSIPALQGWSSASAYAVVDGKGRSVRKHTFQLIGKGTYTIVWNAEGKRDLMFNGQTISVHETPEEAVIAARTHAKSVKESVAVEMARIAGVRLGGKRVAHLTEGVTLPEPIAERLFTVEELKAKATTLPLYKLDERLSLAKLAARRGETLDQVMQNTDEALKYAGIMVGDEPRAFSLDELKIVYKAKNPKYDIGFDEWVSAHWKRANENATLTCPNCNGTDAVSKTEKGYYCDACDSAFSVNEVFKPISESVTVREIAERDSRALASGPGPVKASDEPLAKRYTTFLKRGNTFSPSGPVVVAEKLDACPYEIVLTPWGVEFTKVKPKTDELLKFESSVMNEVVKEVDRFWERQQNYADLGLMHCRGILMYGPPGSGKSCALQQVTEMMVERGDVVFFANNVEAITEGLKAFREVEEKRRVVVCFEEAEALVRYNERALLRLLDGDAKVNNVLYLATTNYIDQISERMLRPGRFDKKIYVGHPPLAGRLAYLEHKLKGAKLAEDGTIKELAKATEGLSFGHMRELLVGAFAMGEPVKDVLARLKEGIGSMKAKLYGERVTEAVQSLDESATTAQCFACDAVLNEAVESKYALCPACESKIDEAELSDETARKFLVPGKSVVIDNVWWTIKNRDIDANKVTLRVSDWAIKDGNKPGTKDVSFTDLVAKIRKGTWGARINGKAIGKQQDQTVRAKLRAKNGLRKAPGTPDVKESEPVVIDFCEATLPALLALYTVEGMKGIDEGDTFTPDAVRDYATKAADIVLSGSWSKGNAKEHKLCREVLKSTGLTKVFEEMDKAAQELDWDGGGEDLTKPETDRLEKAYEAVKELAEKANAVIEAAYNRLRDWSEKKLRVSGKDLKMDAALESDQALVHVLTVNGVRSLLSKIMRARPL